MKSQKDIDAKAIREGKATGSDQRGGQDKLDRPTRDTDDGPKPDSMKPIFANLKDYHAHIKESR